MFTIDYGRATLVIKNITDAFIMRQFPFGGALRPQDAVEIVGQPIEKALFWFYACHYMRGAINSTMAIRKLSHMRKEEPSLFIPEQAMGMDKETLEKYLRNRINYHSRQIANFWVENSRLLVEHFEGDPRAIYNGKDDYRTIADIIANKRVRVGKKSMNGFAGFHGFQRKMSGMLTYFLLDQGLIREAKFDMAIDFHIIRVLVANQVLVAKNRSFRYTDTVQVAALDALAHFHKKHPEYSQLTVCDAVWLLSSTLCNKSPWNKGFDITGEKMESRRGHMRENGITPSVRKKDLLLALPFENIGWNHAGWMKTGVAQRDSFATCGRCPACGTCQYGIPSWDYYQKGIFILREK